MEANYRLGGLARSVLSWTVQEHTARQAEKDPRSARGYHQIVLTRNGTQQTVLAAHRVVAQEFIGFSDKPDVNHKDGDKSNNAVSNLEWSTKKENMDHAIETGLWNPAGEGNGKAKLTLSNVHWIKYPASLRAQGSLTLREHLA